MLLTEHLSGDAYKWYMRHIMNVNCKVQNWTFEGVTHALYDRFVHPSSMQDAHEGFRNSVRNYTVATDTSPVGLSQAYTPETAYSVSVSDGPTAFGGPVWSSGMASQYLTAQTLT